MTWNEIYLKTAQPTLEQIREYIGSPLWQELCASLETGYSIQPVIEHSTCSGAPGWNVKYRKSGRALCTLYPRNGYFTALVSVSAAEATEAEMLLLTCTEAMQALFRRTAPFNGGRWLMIDVTDKAILADTLRLIGLRVKKNKHTHTNA
jgi:hypothetical protein